MADTDLETHEPTLSPGAQLAEDFYSKPEPVPEVKDEPKDDESQLRQEQPEDAGDGQPSGEDAGEPSGEDAGEAQAAPEGDEAADGADAEEVEVTSIEMLAEHLETDPDWIRSLKVTEKVNGKEVEVSLSDALATHRKVAAGDDYLADAKQKAKAMIDESQAMNNELLGNAAAVTALMNQARQMVDGGMTEDDWKQLRRDDPAEYSAKREEQREREQVINNMTAEATRVFKEVTANAETIREQEMIRGLPEQQDKFVEMVPSWADSATAEKESAELQEYFTAAGLTPEKIKPIAFDAVYLNMARKAMLYDRGQQKIETAKKKVVKIPKVMKPGNAGEEQKPTAASNDRVSILYENG